MYTRHGQAYSTHGRTSVQPYPTRRTFASDFGSTKFYGNLAALRGQFRSFYFITCTTMVRTYWLAFVGWNPFDSAIISPVSSSSSMWGQARRYDECASSRLPSVYFTVPCRCTHRRRCTLVVPRPPGGGAESVAAAGPAPDRRVGAARELLVVQDLRVGSGRIVASKKWHRIS